MAMYLGSPTTMENHGPVRLNTGLLTHTYVESLVTGDDFDRVLNFGSIVREEYGNRGIAHFSNDYDAVGVEKVESGALIPKGSTLMISALGDFVICGIKLQAHDALTQSYTGNVVDLTTRVEILEQYTSFEQAVQNEINDIDGKYKKAFTRLNTFTRRGMISYSPSVFASNLEQRGTEAARFTRRSGAIGEALYKGALFFGMDEFRTVAENDGNHIVCLTSPSLAVNFVAYFSKALPEWRRYIAPVNPCWVDMTKIAPISSEYYKEPRVMLLAVRP